MIVPGQPGLGAGRIQALAAERFGCAGVAELADAPDLGSGVERRMSSSLFARTIHAVVAQLVERHLAKVEVASPSLVYRSISALSSVGRAPDS